MAHTSAYPTSVERHVATIPGIGIRFRSKANNFIFGIIGPQYSVPAAQAAVAVYNKIRKRLQTYTDLPAVAFGNYVRLCLSKVFFLDHTQLFSIINL
jgi:hypothetical protein